MSTSTAPMSRLFLKRITGDIKDLDRNRMEFAQAIQDEQNIKLFYFMLRPKDEPYNGGYYIGKIELPDDYPKTPGTFYMLTPSGRFTINSKICLTNSSYHKENWTPIWSIRNMIIGVASIFVADDTTGISHIKDTSVNRKRMAQDSIAYNISHYADIFNKFNFFVNEDNSVKSDEEVNLIVNANKVKQSGETQKVSEQVSEPALTLAPEPALTSAPEPALTPAPEPALTPAPEPAQEPAPEPAPALEKEKTTKVIKRVVKKKNVATDEPQQKEQNEQKENNEDNPKKVVKRVVKKKSNTQDEPVVQLTAEPVDQPDEKPKKVVKRVVKKVPKE